MSTAIEWTEEMKWCTACKTAHSRTAFGADRSRGDGLAASCLEARRRQHRDHYVSRSTGVRRGPQHIVAERDGDRRQARRSVNHLVETGRIPRPGNLPCTDCGHVWIEGERRHEYDHHRGYGVGQHLQVEAVCTTCHHEREARRG